MSESISESNRGTTRWVVLLLLSLIMFANYFLYDCFSTQKATFQTEIGATSTEWGLIRSCYSVPNVFLFMTLIGGVFLDRFGIRRTGFFFTLLCVLGGVATAYGATAVSRDGGPGFALMGSFLPGISPELKMMMFGRLLFGLGAETQLVMLSKTVAKWFMGKELALAFGLKLAMARAGSALAMSMSPRIAERFSFSISLWLGAVIMMSGLILFVIYALIDYRDEKQRGTGDAAALGEDEEFHLNDIFALLKNRSFRLIVLLCAAFYAVIFPFQDYLADLLKHAYGYSDVAAGDLTSLIPWGAVVFTVVFGAFVDKKGKRATLMIGGSLLLVASSLGFALTVPMPWLLVPLFGVSFALVPAAMWPAVALIAGVRRLGTAYGLMYWLQNLCWWSMTLLAGWVLDATNPAVTAETLKAGTGVYDYTATMLLFTAIGVVALAVAIGLKMVDRGPDNHGLELPSAEAAELNDAKRSGA